MKATKTKAVKRKQFAFWKYDLFPFVLGAEILAEFPDGMVETVGYGHGYLFRPIAKLPFKKGFELRHELELMRAEHDTMIRLFNETYNRKAKEVLKEYGI
jgi:hypothetical protein